MTPDCAAPSRRVVRALAGTPFLVALLAAAASAREPYLGGVVQGPFGDPVVELPYEQDGWSEAEFTGGAIFLETGGDAAWIAQDLGFWVSEPYEDLCIAEPAQPMTVWDSLFLCSILNGADPDTRAEPDFFLRDPEGSQSNGIVLPSHFGRQGFDRQPAWTTIRARPAHRTATGKSTLVAVLDTGVDADHAWLDGFVAAGRDFVDDDGDASEGAKDGEDQDGDAEPDDGYGHGTTVAGLLRGAAPEASILPVRVLDEEGRGTAGRIAAGILYAAESGADVINLSLGGQGYSSAVHDAILRAMDRGAIVVAASGNARRPGFPDFPASVHGVLAATGRIGLDGDVWAPSVNLVGPYPGDRWFRGNGTSFSCALVSGGVALMRQRSEAATPWDVLTRLSLGPRNALRLDLSKLAR